MKGIILAGGSGTRLYPITKGISKQLMPIYDKPMIYYPLTTLIEAQIRDILVITTPEDQDQFKRLLGDGSQFGINLEYAVQAAPRGLAEAFIIGENFIGKDSVCLILGDNIFYGAGIDQILLSAKNPDGGIIFAYRVSDPERYGVVEFDENKKVVSIEEKPKQPKSNFAVPGIYFYDNSVINIAKNLKPSSRLEYEITDVSVEYMLREKLEVRIMDRGFAWLDTGTFESMMDASEFIHVLERRQMIKVGSPEEAAYRQKFISAEQLEKLASEQLKSGYGEYLLSLLSYEKETTRLNQERRISGINKSAQVRMNEGIELEK